MLPRELDQLGLGGMNVEDRSSHWCSEEPQLTGEPLDIDRDAAEKLRAILRTALGFFDGERDGALPGVQPRCCWASTCISRRRP